MVPKAGLEPAWLPTRPSNVRVYQFHHFGFDNINTLTNRFSNLCGFVYNCFSMAIVKIDEDNYWDVINEAVSILNEGGIVAYPTETFYGMGARYDSDKALKKIVAIKKRPEEKVFPLIIGRMEDLQVVAPSVNEIEQTLIEEFWPGPLTILFDARDDLSPLISHHGKVAVRLTSSSFARDLSITIGCPITSTSANLSSMAPASDASTVYEYFGDEVDLIIDGGLTQGGLPSTIVSVRAGTIEVVRKGSIDLEGFCKGKGLQVCYK